MSRPAEIRPADLSDIDALLAIEEAVFPGDRLDRRNFRHAIRSPSIISLAVGSAGHADGYVLVETRRGTRVGRLSSIAIAPGAASRGLGRALLSAAERAAQGRGCDRIRLEVRDDNARAAALYESTGYRLTDTVDDYYDDGLAARCYEKRLAED